MNHQEGKHLLSIRALDRQELIAILDRAQYWADQQHSEDSPLQGRFAANLFFEPSTRTRFSFETAQKKLGLHVLNFSADASSVTKGETLYDTLKTIESMGVEAAVVRQKEEGILQPMAEKLNLRLINAGEGTLEHPTQFLLDTLTIRQERGSLQDLKVAIIGDIRHSRVVGSHLWGLPKLGAEVLLSGPPEMMPESHEAMQQEQVNVVPIDEAMQQADIVMMLRIQLERHQSDLYDSAETYHQQYGLTLQRAKQMKPEAKIMHPGPFNRGVEIAEELVEAEQSLIFKQVANGVHVRMAVMERAIGGMGTWQPYSKTVNV